MKTEEQILTEIALDEIVVKVGIGEFRYKLQEFRYQCSMLSSFERTDFPQADKIRSAYKAFKRLAWDKYLDGNPKPSRHQFNVLIRKWRKKFYDPWHIMRLGSIDEIIKAMLSDASFASIFEVIRKEPVR